MIIHVRISGFKIFKFKSYNFIIFTFSSEIRTISMRENKWEIAEALHLPAVNLAENRTKTRVFVSRLKYMKDKSEITEVLHLHLAFNGETRYNVYFFLENSYLYIQIHMRIKIYFYNAINSYARRQRNLLRRRRSRRSKFNRLGHRERRKKLKKIKERKKKNEKLNYLYF